MKLYSDTLTVADLRDCLPPRIALDVIPIDHPRVRSRGWTVRLSDWASNRHKNSGTHGAATWREPAASWDTHGAWMAALYERDPKMKVAHYNDRDDFHAQTSNAYRDAVKA